MKIFFYSSLFLVPIIWSIETASFSYLFEFYPWLRFLYIYRTDLLLMISRHYVQIFQKFEFNEHTSSCLYSVYNLWNMLEFLFIIFSLYPLPLFYLCIIRYLHKYLLIFYFFKVMITTPYNFSLKIPIRHFSNEGFPFLWSIIIYLVTTYTNLHKYLHIVSWSCDKKK